MTGVSADGANVGRPLSKFSENVLCAETRLNGRHKRISKRLVEKSFLVIFLVCC